MGHLTHADAWRPVDGNGLGTSVRWHSLNQEPDVLLPSAADRLGFLLTTQIWSVLLYVVKSSGATLADALASFRTFATFTTFATFAAFAAAT